MDASGPSTYPKHNPTPWLVTEPKGRDRPQGVLMYSQVSPGHPRISSIGSQENSRHVLHIPVYFGTTDPSSYHDGYFDTYFRHVTAYDGR